MLILSGGNYDQSDKDYIHIYCDKKEETEEDFVDEKKWCFMFELYDNYGDGLLAPGHYTVYYGDEIVMAGGGGKHDNMIFGDGERKTVCKELPLLLDANDDTSFFRLIKALFHL